MTKSEEVVFNLVVAKEPDYTIESLREERESSDICFTAISTVSQNFAVWCTKEGWNYYTIHEVWILKGNHNIMKTTSELFECFDNSK